jgi:hypothetical protein
VALRLTLVAPSRRATEPKVIGRSNHHQLNSGQTASWLGLLLWGFSRHLVLVFRYRARVGWRSYGAPVMRTALLISGLALAAGLTVGWDSFIGYEFFRFVELVS